MSPEQKNGFRIAITVFAFVAAFFLNDFGAFDSISAVGVAILIVAFGAVAFFLYQYIKSNTTGFR